jgi:hypothetical protein
MQIARERFVVLVLRGTDRDGHRPDEENLRDFAVEMQRRDGAIGFDEIFVCARPHDLLFSGAKTYPVRDTQRNEGWAADAEFPVIPRKKTPHRRAKMKTRATRGESGRMESVGAGRENSICPKYLNWIQSTSRFRV